MQKPTEISKNHSRQKSAQDELVDSFIFVDENMIQTNEVPSSDAAIDRLEEDESPCEEILRRPLSETLPKIQAESASTSTLPELSPLSSNGSAGTPQAHPPEIHMLSSNPYFGTFGPGLGQFRLKSSKAKTAEPSTEPSTQSTRQPPKQTPGPQRDDRPKPN